MSEPVETIVLDEDAAAGRAAATLSTLTAAGVKAGDVIAALAGNGVAAVAARDAATAGELLFAPINPRLAPPEIAWLLGHARPRALLVDRAHAAVARSALTGVAAAPPVIVVDELAPAAGRDLRELYRERTGATLLYTSGTTGRPKGCVRTAAQDRARAIELTASYALSADDVHLIACPLAHSAPGIFLRTCRGAGARTVIQAQFRAEAFLEAVAAHRATVCFLVPTQWQRLLALPEEQRADADVSSLRAAIVAGAPLAAATKARILDWLGPDRLWEFYGSSETGTVSVIGPGEHLANPGSVGRAPAGVSVAIVDEHGAPLPPGELGEVWVRSPAVMEGYLQDDGSIARVGGALSVGDLGRIDAAGWLTLVDRKHDTIITGGVNVYPAEVERVLAEHPAVAGVVAFGLADDDWGQIVAAVLALRPGATIDADELLGFARERIAAYKLPRAIATCALDALPIGGSGKALRRAARDQFAPQLRRVR